MDSKFKALFSFIAWSAGAFVFGFAVPQFIRLLYSLPDAENQKAFWRVIEIYSGIFCLGFEKVYHWLYHIKKDLDDLDKKLGLTLAEVSRSIAQKLEAEKTILRIPLQNTDIDAYIGSLLNLHRKVNETIKNGHVISYPITILQKSTLGLKDFFNRSKGGLYSIDNAVMLYKEIAFEAKSITIIEPQYIEDYSEKYSENYISFIEQLSKKMKKKYIYRSGRGKENSSVLGILKESFVRNNPLSWINLFIKSNTLGRDIKNGSTDTWLKRYNFTVLYFEIPGIPTDADIKWSKYSHLLFGFDTYFISCSVLPLFKPDQANTIAGSPPTYQNFQDAEVCHLAFRVITTTTVSNGDNWFHILLRYNNHVP